MEFTRVNLDKNPSAAMKEAEEKYEPLRRAIAKLEETGGDATLERKAMGRMLSAAELDRALERILNGRITAAQAKAEEFAAEGDPVILAHLMVNGGEQYLIAVEAAKVASQIGRAVSDGADLYGYVTAYVVPQLLQRALYTLSAVDVGGVGPLSNAEGLFAGQAAVLILDDVHFVYDELEDQPQYALKQIRTH